MATAPTYLAGGMGMISSHLSVPCATLTISKTTTYLPVVLLLSDSRVLMYVASVLCEQKARLLRSRSRPFPPLLPGPVVVPCFSCDGFPVRGQGVPGAVGRGAGVEAVQGEGEDTWRSTPFFRRCCYRCRRRNRFGTLFASCT